MTVALKPGRTDASQEQTDVESFEVLEPLADGFRNYQHNKSATPAEELLEKYHGAWGKSVEPVFTEYAY